MLTAEQKAFFQENGYVHVPGLLTREEAAFYRKECHDLIERLARVQSVEATWGSARKVVEGAKQTQLLHCHNVQFYSAAFTRLLCNDRFTAAAADLIGPNIQLHHCKMFVKPPEKGSPFPMHQDHPYFPHENHTMIACTFYFDDAPEEKGPLRFVPGSHKLGPIEHIADGGFHLSPDQYPLERSVSVPGKAGDAIFFSYLTIHGSGINVSSEPRTTMLVQMRDPLDPPSVRTHESRGQGMMLRGIDPSCCKTQPLREEHELPVPGRGMM